MAANKPDRTGYYSPWSYVEDHKDCVDLKRAFEITSMQDQLSQRNRGTTLLLPSAKDSSALLETVLNPGDDCDGFTACGNLILQASVTMASLRALAKTNGEVVTAGGQTFPVKETKNTITIGGATVTDSGIKIMACMRGNPKSVADANIILKVDKLPTGGVYLQPGTRLQMSKIIRDLAPGVVTGASENGSARDLLAKIIQNSCKPSPSSDQINAIITEAVNKPSLGVLQQLIYLFHSPDEEQDKTTYIIHTGALLYTLLSLKAAFPSSTQAGDASDELARIVQAVSEGTLKDTMRADRYKQKAAQDIFDSQEEAAELHELLKPLLPYNATQSKQDAVAELANVVKVITGCDNGVEGILTKFRTLGPKITCEQFQWVASVLVAIVSQAHIITSTYGPLSSQENRGGLERLLAYMDGYLADDAISKVQNIAIQSRPTPENTRFACSVPPYVFDPLAKLLEGVAAGKYPVGAAGAGEGGAFEEAIRTAFQNWKAENNEGTSQEFCAAVARVVGPE